jgi:hypothetical protein
MHAIATPNIESIVSILQHGNPQDAERLAVLPPAKTPCLAVSWTTLSLPPLRIGDRLGTAGIDHEVSLLPTVHARL